MGEYKQINATCYPKKKKKTKKERKRVSQEQSPKGKVACGLLSRNLRVAGERHGKGSGIPPRKHLLLLSAVLESLLKSKRGVSCSRSGFLHCLPP